jgi:acylphosphatase
MLLMTMQLNISGMLYNSEVKAITILIQGQDSKSKKLLQQLTSVNATPQEI